MTNPSQAKQWSRGSEWHRWDPHIHTPCTLLNNQFQDKWEDYIKAINNARPTAHALGIADYCCIRGYREFRKRWLAGHLPNVALIFPNVELRLSMDTERHKAINIHLLFSPDDPDHEAQIERILAALTFSSNESEYRCTEDDLRRLGRASDPKQAGGLAALAQGALQFKPTLGAIQGLFKSERWMRDNCLVAVAAGEGDGTSGLQKDAGLAQYRRELERFASIIFSSKPSDRTFWLGQKPGADLAFLEDHYRGPKPCLHGCDAHRMEEVLTPAQGRCCWIRSELTFEGLRQTLLEPEVRVAIGSQPPPGPAQFDAVRTVEVSNAVWLRTQALELNGGLVAIVGPKGSGKTALADIIARGAGAIVDPNSSFLSKAAEHLGSSCVRIGWGDSRVGNHVRLAHFAEDTDQPRVRYLSQQFVERLCSSDGLGKELVDEIESVVFLATDEADRLEATTFAELRSTKLEQIEATRDEHVSSIASISDEIAAEESLKEQLPGRRVKLEELNTKIEAETTELNKLLPSDKSPHAARLSKLEAASRAAEEKVQKLELRSQKLKELAEEVGLLRSRRQQDYLALRSRFGLCALSDQQWALFRMDFVGDVDSVTVQASKEASDAVRTTRFGTTTGGPLPDDLGMWPLRDLRTELERLQKEVGVEKEKAKKYKELQQSVKTASAEREKLKKEITHASAADSRRKAALERRREAYASVFETLEREQEVLESLYAPLSTHLKADQGVAKLEFYVHRKVDIVDWVERGENLLDLRRQGPFQGKGALDKATREILLPAWRDGGKDDVAAAMHEFVDKYGAALKRGLGTRSTVAQLAEWLFSTEHVSLQYGIRYEGVEIERLSPGTRGIVLLLLYLAVDKWDTRPLLIDQPEENLDPQSVFDELVEYFRGARTRRQVILVTHNPNLVVNTDADQVIVASGVRGQSGCLPHITYTSGGLEDRDTRDAVCRILEGGERAFEQRDLRYGLSRRRLRRLKSSSD